jgi:hypothetical protein
VADYQARINLLVAGQDSLSRIQRQVEDLEGAITAVERRWRTASAALTRSRTVLGVTGTDLPRGAGGRFAQDPDRQQRINALAAQRQAAIQERIARLTASRTRQEIDNVNTRLAAQERLNRRVENQIALESRLNAAVDLYRTNLRKFERGGSGRQDPALVRNAEAIQEAFAAFEAGGSRNLRLVRSLATELGRVGEAQRELNRAQSLGSKGFEAGRRLQERLSVVAQAGTTSPERVRAARSMATEAISASRSGDQQAYTEAIRRATAATSRLERESRETAAALDAQQREIARLARLGGPSSPVQGAVDLIGSPINKAMGTKAAVALAQQKEKAAADELKALQKGTKDAVALAQQKQKSLDTQSKERTGMLQNALIGGAFPMLFGGGAGAVAGGFAGGFIEGNPMMSIVTSALGTVVDQFVAGVAEMGVAVRDLVGNFDKLKEANLFVSKEQEFYIQKLIESGRAQAAANIIQQRLIDIIGTQGVQDLENAGQASTRLNKAFAELGLQIQALIAGPLGVLLDRIGGAVALPAASNRATVVQQQLVKQGDKAAAAALGQRVQGIETGANVVFGFDPKQAAKDIKEVTDYYAQFVEKTEKNAPVSLIDKENAIKAAEQVADTIKGAYRTGFQLQQQAIDLQRQGTDLQRRVADDIFNKQQQIARLQIDNERQRQQIAIETVDLEYRRRISQEEGRVAEALAAEADLLKTRAQGEANIGNAKRLLELDIAKQQRDTENYVYQLGREIENIRRSTLNYEMQVADYRLDIERKVAAERRIENAGTASGSIPSDTVNQFAASAFPGQTTSKQGSFPAYIPKEKLRAFLESQGFGRTSGDFTNAGHKTPNHTLNAMDMGILGGSDANALRRTSEMEKKLRATGAFGNQLFGPISDPYGHGAGKGGQNIHLHIPTPGGKVKMTAKLNDLMQGKGGFTSSTASQLTTAESQVTARPAVPTVDAAGAGATLANLNAKDAAIRKEAIALQEKLNQLQESAALQRLEEVARGPIDLQQRRDAIEYAKADLSVVQVGNSELQDRLAFEAQSLVKLQIRVDRDKEILENTKLQGSERKKLEDALQKGLAITQQQIELDREALRLAQEKRFAVEEANIQSQLGVTGTGLKAGFIGPAAGAFESEMLKSGNTEQATRLAELTNQLTLAQVQAQGMESSVLAIGDAFGTAMTSGVASLIDGTATAEQVFAQFLNTIAQALLQAAAKMIATYIAIAIAKAIAGMGGGGGDPVKPGGDWMSAVGRMSPNANGNAFGANGIMPFAKGGAFTNSIVSSPTMFKFADGGAMRTGLMGEAGPEAIMPLSRGADGSLGVQANGLREAMDRQQGGANGSPVLNMSFQSTNINGVEYVSRDQLESAMAETRRNATRDGAKRGMTMTLDRIQNSSSTRRKVGI